LGGAVSEVKRPQVRGHFVDPQTLISQVENTAPFLFSAEAKDSERSGPNAYVSFLNAAKENPPSSEDLWDYFDLCLVSHFATVGTFVPTDIDLAIRIKLWGCVHGARTFAPIWKRVEEFHHWDESLVSKRFVLTPTHQKLSGHQGEWFTVAMGAYGASLKIGNSEDLPEVRETIELEFKNQELALTELFENFAENTSIDTMKTLLGGIAAVAHNLGDLDRMFDQWEIADTDVLKRRVYRAGHEDAKNPKKVFLLAGKIYQELLATENHRHFAMREPKCLRRATRFLLPFGPFFDDWGKKLVDDKNADALDEGELREVAEALIMGYKKLNPLSIYTSQGYARALTGMSMAYGEKLAAGSTTAQKLKVGREELVRTLPPLLKKELNEGGLRTLMALTQSEFEKKSLVKLNTLIKSAE
jgi:hypothetical protein